MPSSLVRGVAMHAVLTTRAAEENWAKMKQMCLVKHDMPLWVRHHIASGSNILRVFFSSPFGGMEREREILTKQYFPELRVLCEQAGLTFVPIDLRWGWDVLTVARRTAAQASRSRTQQTRSSSIFVSMRLSDPISLVRYHTFACG